MKDVLVKVKYNCHKLRTINSCVKGELFSVKWVYSDILLR